MKKDFYYYKALKADNTEIDNFIYIQNKQQLYSRLKQENLKLIKAYKPNLLVIPFSKKRLLFILKEWFYFLSHLLKNEIPLIESLQMLCYQTNSTYLKSILYKIIDDLENGLSFSKALQNQKNVFNMLIIHTIKTAEKTGDLSKSFIKLYDYLSWKLNFSEKIIQSLRYPIFLMIFIISIASILNVYFIPELMSFLKDNPIDSLSLTMWFWVQQNSSSIFFIAFFIIFSTLILLKSLIFLKDKYAKNIFQFIYCLPGFHFYYRLNILRSFKTLCLVLESGIDLKEALAYAREEISIPYLHQNFEHVEKNLLKGASLSVASSKILLIDSMMIRFIQLGENTGDLSKHLSLCMDHYHDVIQNDLERYIRLLQPSFIFITGLLLLWMVTAFLTPLYNHFPGLVS